MNMQIVIDHLNYIYAEGTTYARAALADINLVINKGEFIGVIGHTGSGKSTLISHLNGLLKPTSGTIYFEGEDIHEKGYSKKKLRSKVGVVFQYPEYQLFAESVIEDVKFGPRNMGFDNLTVDYNSYEALKLTGIGEDLLDVSPLELSGGQKRRVAIAGVLAMKPEVLILDEPTAGLDPKGREDILNLLKRLNNEQNMTIILISHSMEDIANYCNRLIVLNDGKIFADGSVRDVFGKYNELENIGLSAPQAVNILKKIKNRGYNIDISKITCEEAVEEIVKLIHCK